MRTLDEKIRYFAEKAKDGVPNEDTQAIKKRLSDIRDLLIKADVAVAKGRNPSFLYDRIEEKLDEIDNLNHK